MAKYCQRNKLYHSELVRKAILAYIPKHELNREEKRKIVDMLKWERIKAVEESLKFSMKVTFMNSNFKNILIKAIGATYNRKDVLGIIKNMRSMAGILKHKDIIKSMKGMEAAVKDPETWRQLKAQCLEYQEAKAMIRKGAELYE